MSFHNQSFNNRLATMGDPAEEACDKVYEYKTHDLGLNRVWKNGVGLYMVEMTAAMRYTPDRMVRDRNIECMGIGRDRTLKIKHEKIAALRCWEQVGPIDLFVFDKPNETYYQASIETWYNACINHADEEAFHDGKTYYGLHEKHFPSKARVVPDVEAPTPI